MRFQLSLNNLESIDKTSIKMIGKCITVWQLRDARLPLLPMLPLLVKVVQLKDRYNVIFSAPNICKSTSMRVFEVVQQI